MRTEAGRGRPQDGGGRIPSAIDGTDSPGRDATLPLEATIPMEVIIPMEVTIPMSEDRRMANTHTQMIG